MKRKLTVLAVCLCASAAVLTGCTVKAKANGNVKLGEYKNIEIQKISTEVTDKEVDSYIDSILSQNADSTEITDRAVAQGDTVNIDFKGLKDGVAFEGGTAEGAELGIGSGQFIEGFEEKLVGVMPGSQVEISLTFPEDYGVEELEGQDVVFEVKVNYIVGKIIPELNDEFVQSVSESETVEKYKEEVKAELQKQLESDAKQQGLQTIMQTIMENSEVVDIPQEMINKEVEAQKENYSQYSQMYGMEFAEFVSMMFGMTEEEFNVEIQEEAANTVKRTMILNEIARKEKIKLKKKELDTRAVEYGFTDFKSLAEEYGEEMVKEVMLMDKVSDYLYDHAKIQ